MKTILLLLGLMTFASSFVYAEDEYVDGYRREDGRYIQSHKRGEWMATPSYQGAEDTGNEAPTVETPLIRDSVDQNNGWTQGVWGHPQSENVAEVETKNPKDPYGIWK